MTILETLKRTRLKPRVVRLKVAMATKPGDFHLAQGSTPIRFSWVQKILVKNGMEPRSWMILIPIPIGSMYGIYTNIGGILMVNVTIYSIHGSYGIFIKDIKGR